MKHSSKSEKSLRLLAVRPLVVLILVLAISLSTTVYGLSSHTTKIAGKGTMKAVGVEVYWDNACTSPITSIDWGSSIEPGSKITNVIYMKNTGNVPVTLSLSTNNWSPSSASSKIKLNWDYADQSVNAGQIVKVTLTLSVSSSISITSFKFDIAITARG